MMEALMLMGTSLLITYLTFLAQLVLVASETTQYMEPGRILLLSL